MSKVKAGVVLIVVGIFLAVLALTADKIGIGGGRGFGWKQWASLVAGVVMFLVGGGLALIKPKR